MKQAFTIMAVAVLLLMPAWLSAAERRIIGSPAEGIPRAFVNMVAAPMEVPHAVMADLNHYSVAGFGTGPLKGSVYGIGRFLAGTADLLSIGLLTDEYSPYHAFCLEPALLERNECGPPRAPRPPPPPPPPAPPKLPAILLEVVDLEDPLIAGEETTYKITVMNQGTKEDRNVTVTAKFPKELTPLSAAGATAGTVEDSLVSFKPYGSLAPKETIVFTIKAKAVQVGDGRVRVKVLSDFLATPLSEEESTHVY